MKKIKDERLIIQNLKNIRIAFIVQTIGISAILIYEVVTKGPTEAIENPLWLVFMLTMVVFLWLHLKISIDVYDDAEKQKKPTPYHLMAIISALIGVIVALVAKLGPYKSSNIEALIVWGIAFVCFLIPSTFVCYLLKKHSEDRDI
ncbi:MAG: hypothetical protein PHI24_10650 [Desulfitobacteriaceae bacterium]|nr:hypothetical protein [Desulfitobacteriaceae bacterium]